jgi:hypothetical protein
VLDEAWAAIAGTEVPPPLELTGAPVEPDVLPSTLPVFPAALACVGTALRAAALLGGAPRVTLDPGQLAAAVTSEGWLRINGESLGGGFAPLSRFWPTADGWIRTHANYPWHRAALFLELGLAAGSGPDEVAAVLAQLPGEQVKQRLIDAGGVAAVVRSPEQWSAHPQGAWLATQPLVADTRIDGARPRPTPGTATPERPLAGTRVVDLTTVIAGPVATRFLAAAGAEVLRLDSPHRPELPIHRYDGLPGKRSALLDVATAPGLDRLHELLDGADVLVHGYRPGALARFGLDGDSLAQRHPGLVAVSLSAWGADGPWGERRGFDSLVQAATGIAVRESVDGSYPGAMPCQLLDHGTGYLAAAAVADGLRRQRALGGSHQRHLALARTAAWLLREPSSAPGATARRPSPDPRWLVTLASDVGPVTTVRPPGALDDTALAWPDLPIAYGAAPPRWL